MSSIRVCTKCNREAAREQGNVFLPGRSHLEGFKRKGFDLIKERKEVKIDKGRKKKTYEL